MKKHRLNTTISGKHYALLKKYVEKYGTQQGVLEYALEELENYSNQTNKLSPEEKLWMRIGTELRDIFTIFPRELTRLMFETVDIEQLEEYFKNAKQVEFAIEWYHNKYLKECTLQEVIDAMILNIKMQSSADTLDYNDNGDHYIINMTHRLGINAAFGIIIMNESALNSYGVEFESYYSERSIFFKIFK